MHPWAARKAAFRSIQSPSHAAKGRALRGFGSALHRQAGSPDPLSWKVWVGGQCKRRFQGKRRIFLGFGGRGERRSYRGRDNAGETFWPPAGEGTQELVYPSTCELPDTHTGELLPFLAGQLYLAVSEALRAPPSDIGNVQSPTGPAPT